MENNSIKKELREISRSISAKEWLQSFAGFAFLALDIIAALLILG